MLEVVPATLRWLDLVLPFPDQWRHCSFRLRDAAGQVVSQESDLTPAGVGLNPWRWRAQQPFGLFTLEAVLDGRRHTWPVDLSDPATGDRPLRFSLR